MSKVPATFPDFSAADGLLPAVAQDEATGEILMLAFMNAESFAETLATGRAVYYSRSRRRLWRHTRLLSGSLAIPTGFGSLTCW